MLQLLTERNDKGTTLMNYLEEKQPTYAYYA